MIIFNSIISDCKPGFYNSTTNCTSGCGHCKNKGACDSESGSCPDGCEQHFEAPNCQGTQKYNIVQRFLDILM